MPLLFEIFELIFFTLSNSFYKVKNLNYVRFNQLNKLIHGPESVWFPAEESVCSAGSLRVTAAAEESIRHRPAADSPGLTLRHATTATGATATAAESLRHAATSHATAESLQVSLLLSTQK